MNISFQINQIKDNSFQLQEKKNDSISNLDEFPIHQRNTTNNNTQTLNKMISQKNEGFLKYDENLEPKTNLDGKFSKNNLHYSKIDLLKHLKDDQCNFYKFLFKKN